ncbi:MAG: PKD domain-containing protein, partial [Hydrotalea sp.]|nr:PKD domain-containing protein [Hydrotalea sp.]
GVVTGVAAGTTTITYTVSNDCGTATRTQVVTVNAAPAQPAVITGTAQVCIGNTTQLSSATAGGTWSSSNASVATINASGVVTGVAAGTTTITYTVSNDCGTATRTQVVTVNDCTPPPPPPPPAPAPCYPKGVVDLGTSASAAEALFSRLDFSAEARIGGASTYELDIHRIQPFTVFSPTQEFAWQNGVAVPFTVTYNPSAIGNNKFIFTVGSGASTRTLQIDPANPPSGSAFPTDFNGIWFFTRGSSTGNSLISDLTLNGESLSNIDVTNTSSNLVLRGYTISQGFNLTGKITYSWTGTMPTQSNLNFNVKLGKLNGNPAPICGFTVNNESQDLTGNSFVFTAQPPTSGNTYSWNFGDGSPVKTGTQVSHTFTQVGNYVVTVTVSGPGGCTSVCTKTVFVTNGVSGGATGGIESYSLGEVIGKRNIAKAKSGQLGETNYGATPKWNGTVSNDRGGVATMSTGAVRLADLIPAQVSGLQAFVTSPTDLTQFTNAVEVM